MAEHQLVDELRLVLTALDAAVPFLERIATRAKLARLNSPIDGDNVFSRANDAAVDAVHWTAKADDAAAGKKAATAARTAAGAALRAAELAGKADAYSDRAFGLIRHDAKDLAIPCIDRTRDRVRDLILMLERAERREGGHG